MIEHFAYPRSVILWLRPNAKFIMKIYVTQSMNKCAHKSTPTEVNVQSTTTPDSHSITTSDTWLSQYLVVD